jgi:cytochrome P450
VTWEDLPGLPTAQRVFQEAIRLYPPVWRISRHARESDQLGGFHVPSGSVVIISPYLMHHDPTNWPDPERFDPGRFDPATSELRSMGRYYLPFGAGQRMCPGGSFSTAEAQVILATLCRRFVFQPVPTFEPSFEPRLTLRPKGGMPLRLVATKNPAKRL